jgi:hypothetical protein
MFCNVCGQQVSTNSTFCNRCGNRSATEQPSAQPSRIPQPTVGGQAGLIAGSATRKVLGAGPKVWIVAAVVLLLIVAVISFNTSQHPTTQPSSTPTERKTETVAAVSRPTSPPPPFRVYGSKRDQGTSVVVSPTTTDEQLKSLLWLFREKVRAHRFKDIGITQPTSRQFGKTAYLSGMIEVYRGDKCANEIFTDFAGTPAPCGPDEHDSAWYQWGLLVDGVFDTDADSAFVISADGKTVPVFDYKDHWQLPAKLQAGLDAERKTEQDKDKVK